MNDDPTIKDWLDVTVTQPQHVVHRSFVQETVVLNLQTGKYHGLNVTAGRMLDVLAAGQTIREVSRQLAAEYGRPVEELQADVVGFCRALLARQLIELAAT